MNEQLAARSPNKSGRVALSEDSIVEGVTLYVLTETPMDWRSGGCGTVCIAQRLTDKQTFAAKFIHLDRLNDEEKLRVIREIDNMEKVSKMVGCVSMEEHFQHYDFVMDELEEMQYGTRHEPGTAIVLILEYMDQGDLGSMILDGKLTDASIACTIFLQVIVGLHQLHQNNILHRDIGAGNILVNSNGLVKIGDFGFSNSYEGETRREDAVQTQLGTVCYRPPEIWRKERYGASADIFALGVLMFEAISQTWAFGDFQMETVKELMQNTAQPLGCEDPRVDALVAAMVDQNPRLRPTTSDLLRSEVMQEAYARLLNSFHERPNPEFQSALCGVMSSV